MFNRLFSKNRIKCWCVNFSTCAPQSTSYNSAIWKWNTWVLPLITWAVALQIRQGAARAWRMASRRGMCTAQVCTHCPAAPYSGTPRSRSSFAAELCLFWRHENRPRGLIKTGAKKWHSGALSGVHNQRCPSNDMPRINNQRCPSNEMPRIYNQQWPSNDMPRINNQQWPSNDMPWLTISSDLATTCPGLTISSDLATTFPG